MVDSGRFRSPAKFNLKLTAPVPPAFRLGGPSSGNTVAAGPGPAGRPGPGPSVLNGGRESSHAGPPSQAHWPALPVLAGSPLRAFAAPAGTFRKPG